MKENALEQAKQDILNILSEAKDEGLNKTALKVRSKTRKQAFEELEKSGEIANLGTKWSCRYVLQEHFNPFEKACESIEETMEKEPVRPALFIRSELEKGCVGAVKKEFPRALDWLVNDGKVRKIKRKRVTFFEHISSVMPFLKAAKEEKAEAAGQDGLSFQRAILAYEKVKNRLGYTNVEIYELQRELGVPMEMLKWFLKVESRNGRATLTLGDWSLSSEAVRSGAVDLLGKPHLLVSLYE